MNEKTEATEAKPVGAPEKYEDFKVPDGQVLDPDVVKEVGDLFKGLNLTQEGGQKLIDFYTAKTKEAFEAPFKAWQDTNESWQKELLADPDLSTGGKLKDSVKSTVAKAIDGLADPKLASAFREAMDTTGMGNNPAFVRVLFKLASKLTEGSHVEGRGPSPHGQNSKGEATRPSYANAIYGPDGPNRALRGQ